MKTNASTREKMPVVTFPIKDSIRTNNNVESVLSIKNNALGIWIETINRSNGVFFFDLHPLADKNNYCMHYKDHLSGKLLELTFEGHDKDCSKNKYLECLVFDLQLFQGNEPIIVFDRKSFETHLKELSPILFEHTDVLDLILDRVYDLKEVIDEKLYYDTRFKSTTIEAIYQVLFDKPVEMSNSMALYQIYEALQSIYLQVTGLKIVA